MAEVDVTIANYVRAASAHGVATEAGDYRAANSAARAIASAHRKLVHLGGQERLASLLKHPDPGVRLWAASHALTLFPSDAKDTLANLAKEPESLIGMSAEMTLRECQATIGNPTGPDQDTHDMGDA